MIVCRRCSRRHADGTEFCTCGAYLAFDGEAVEEEQASDSRPDAGGGAPPTPAQPQESTSGEPAPWSGFGDTAPQPAPTDESTAVLPAEANRHDRPVEFEPGPTGRPDDLVCPSCGTRSPGGSRFCRHCGHDLAGNASGLVVEESSERKRRRFWPQRPAGARSGRASGRRLAGRVMLLRAGGVAVVLAMFAAFLGPWRGSVSSGLGDGLQLTRYDQIEVAPDAVRTASSTDPVQSGSTRPYRTAERAVDGFSNTTWATDWDDLSELGDDDPDVEDGCAAWRTDDVLVVDFAEPTDIDRIQVLGGRTDPTRDDFYRPRVLQFAGGDECEIKEIDDEADLVKVGVSLDDVTSLTVGVIALYDGGETDPTVEISELVFEKK